MRFRDETAAVHIVRRSEQLMRIAYKGWWPGPRSSMPYYEDDLAEKEPGRAVSDAGVGPPVGYRAFTMRWL